MNIKYHIWAVFTHVCVFLACLCVCMLVRDAQDKEGRGNLKRAGWVRESMTSTEEADVWFQCEALHVSTTTWQEKNVLKCIHVMRIVCFHFQALSEEYKGQPWSHDWFNLPNLDMLMKAGRNVNDLEGLTLLHFPDRNPQMSVLTLLNSPKLRNCFKYYLL